MSAQELVSPLYCTWPYRESLPPALRRYFRDLDHFLRELVASATSSLLIAAPYLSPAGMTALQPSIATAAQPGAWVRLITGNMEDADGWNRRAIRSLLNGEEGEIIRRRFRVLTARSETPVLLHAKVVIADGTRAYLGSANISLGALERNLELGVALEAAQAETLERLFSFLEGQGLLVDWTLDAIR
jgi:cardiolipin synthase